MKKSLSILIVVMILISLFSLFGNAANYQWKLAHGRPLEAPLHKDVSWLVDQLKERSNGRINIDIFPNYQLGDYTVVQERISLGDIEMSFACLGTERDKRLMVLPYVVSNWEEAQKVYSAGSAYTNIVAEILEDQNLKLISGWPSYFGGICLTKLPPSLADPDVPKNLKIRVPPQKSYELVAQALGYMATPIPYAEAYTAMQSGIVDGVIGGGAEGYYTGFRDVMKYYLPINDHLEMWYFYMNLDLWNSLSKEDQQLIQDLGGEVEKKRWAIAEEDQKAFIQKLSDYGIKVITFTDEELAGFAKKVREYVWPKMKEDVGSELIDIILAQ